MEANHSFKPLPKEAFIWVHLNAKIFMIKWVQSSFLRPLAESGGGGLLGTWALRPVFPPKVAGAPGPWEKGLAQPPRLT